MQILPVLIAENATLGTESSRRKNFVETLGQERRNVVMLTSNVCDSVETFKKIWADAEGQKKKNRKLAGEVLEKAAHATMVPARLNDTTEALGSV